MEEKKYLPDMVDTYITYQAIARFLEKYNYSLKNEEISDLISSIDQPGMDKGLVRMWFQTLKETVDALEDEERKWGPMDPDRASKTS